MPIHIKDQTSVTQPRISRLQNPLRFLRYAFSSYLMSEISFINEAYAFQDVI